MKTPALITTVAVATVIAGAGISVGIVSFVNQAQDSKVATAASPSTREEQTTSPASSTEPGVEVKPTVATTDELLLYLIEEEKLAHDVYTVLGDKWGSNVFTNILASETQHQDQVLSLLNAYGLSDPRSTELGVFTNPDLQALYDQLIAQGSTSVTDAYKVGELIEETDIADLSEAMATTSDQTILSTLQSLLSASENHLNAFQRKL